MSMKYREVSRRLSKRTVYSDVAFQRRLSWTQHEMNGFLSSASKKWTRTPLSLVDVDACLSLAKETGDTLSMDYFQDLKDKDYKYVSVDGQNRTKYIIDFMNNLVTFSGILYNSRGVPMKFENVFLKDIQNKHPRYADAIEDLEVKIDFYTDVSRSQLADLFRSINSGVDPSPHALRQSQSTPVAGWIRELSKRHQNWLTRIFKNPAILSMYDDEYVAKLAMILMTRYRGYEKHWRLSAGDVDAWYELGLGFYGFEDRNCPYLQSEKTRVEAILDVLSSILTKQNIYSPSLWFSKQFVIACLFTAEYIHDNQLFVLNYADCAQIIFDLDDELDNKSRMAYQDKRTDYISRGMDPKDVEKTSWYHVWRGVPHKKDDRNLRKAEFLKEISKKHKELTFRNKPSKNSKAA